MGTVVVPKARDVKRAGRRKKTHTPVGLLGSGESGGDALGFVLEVVIDRTERRFPLGENDAQLLLQLASAERVHAHVRRLLRGLKHGFGGEIDGDLVFLGRAAAIRHVFPDDEPLVLVVAGRKKKVRAAAGTTFVCLFHSPIQEQHLVTIETDSGIRRQNVVHFHHLGAGERPFGDDFTRSSHL